MSAGAQFSNPKQFGVELSFADVHYSKAQVARLARCLAASLACRGLRLGDKVVAVLDNGPELVLSCLSCLQLGVTFVPLSTSFPLTVLQRIIGSVRPDAVIANSRLLKEIAPASNDDGQLSVKTAFTATGEIVDLGELVKRDVQLPRYEPPDETAIAVIHFTSGSTSAPKGVMLTHRAVRYVAEATCTALRYTSSDTLGILLPLHHSYGLSLLSCAMLSGARIVLLRTSPGLVRELLTARCTTFDSVPSVYALILKNLRSRPDFVNKLRGTIRMWCCGGEMLSVRLFDQFLSTMKLPILNGYGLTEAGPNIALNSSDDWRRESVGRPLPGLSIKIDAEGDAGGVGEILVRSPGNMAGYWMNSEATSAAFTEGWLRTGDIGFVDEDGHLHVLGRKDSLIISAGHNVNPADVEEALRAVPGISNAVVIEIPDKARGADIAAFLEADPDCSATLNKTAIRQHLRRRLPAFAVPRHLEWMDELPKLAGGKIDRRALRERISAGSPAEGRRSSL